MKICISGWYFADPENRVEHEAMVRFYDVMKQANKSYPVFIASHFKSDFLEKLRLPYAVTRVYGLELYSYDWYLRNQWDSESSVLFMHDDERIAGPWVFKEIEEACKDIDQGYLFQDFAECQANGGKHGRGIYCNKKFLDFILGYECNCREAKDHFDEHNPTVILPGVGVHTGFFYDPYNNGQFSGTRGKPGFGMRHYNSSIYHMMGIVGRAKGEGLNVGHKIFIKGFESGRRGLFGQYERTRKILAEKEKNIEIKGKK